MNKLIGWMFILLNPITGGSFLAGMVYQLVCGGRWEVAGIIISGVWIMLFCLWFDGSRYQRSLLN